PSVVYGFWGINVLAPQVQRLFDLMGGPNIGGKSLFAAGLILAVMIVPYAAAVSYDVCQAVPRRQREGALALGATRWQSIWKAGLPYARPALAGGCFLALGRAIGETIAVTMLIGNPTRIEFLPFGQGSTIPSVLAQELPGPETEMHRAALIQLALVLFGVTILMNVLARMLIWQVGRPRRGLTLLARLFQRRHDPAASLPGLTPSGSPAVPSRRAEVVNRVMTGVLGLCLAITCGPLFLILGYITVRGLGALDWAFFVRLP